MTDFNADSLNGVTFAAGALFGVPSSVSYSAADHDVTVPRASTAFNPAGAISINVVGDTYTPATSTSLATFGQVEVTNAQGQHYFSLIIGYTSNAVLLGYTSAGTPGTGGVGFSQTQIPAQYYHFFTQYVKQGNVFVLSNSPSSSTTFPLVFADNVPYTPPCFAQGSRLLTPRGETVVEALAVGDRVVTASGAVRPVVWIGSRRITVAAHPEPAEVNPILIRAGAFAEGAPSRDLRLSPGHAVFVDGVLVPAGRLVNGATIVQEEVVAVRYFHVELDAHDVILAEGLACESYLDDGNRQIFANAPGHVALHGRLDPLDWAQACAPVVRDGKALAAIQARLHGRAGDLGWVKTEADRLRLLADGVEIAPLRAAGSRFWFCAPAAARLTLVSNAARPCDLTPGAADTRRLGVAVAELRVDGRVRELDDAAFGAGFLAVEREGDAAWRWTDGAAVLALDGPAMVEVVLHMVAQSWSRPAAPYLKLVRVG
jgi:hypothetical protein